MSPLILTLILLGTVSIYRENIPSLVHRLLRGLRVEGLQGLGSEGLLSIVLGF